MLHPENAEHADYLSGLSQWALASEPESPSVLDEKRDWTARLDLCPSVYRYPHRWDLHETTWTIPIGFFGGQYLAFSGGDPGARFHLEVLLRALFLGGLIDDLEQSRQLSRLAKAVLSLSTYLVRSSGADRYAPAAPRTDEIPTFPGDEDFARLLNFVVLSPEELDDVTGGLGSYLEPLIFDYEDGAFPKAAPGSAGFERWPVIRFDDGLVVASPPDMVLALRHALIVAVIDSGHREQLARGLLEQSLQAAGLVASLMRWRHVQTFTSRDELLGQMVFSLDTDKAAVVTVIADDLEAYDPHNPQADWDAFSLDESVAAGVAEAELDLVRGQGLNEILELVVLSGCGRPCGFGLRDDLSPTGGPTLLMGGGRTRDNCLERSRRSRTARVRCSW